MRSPFAPAPGFAVRHPLLKLLCVLSLVFSAGVSAEVKSSQAPQKKKPAQTAVKPAKPAAADPLKTAAPAPNSGETRLDTIEVYASPFSGRTADELVVPVTVIKGAELDRKRSSNIGEVLANEPGISTTGFGPRVGRPVIRGQYGPRVQVLENGISSMDVSDISPDHAVTIDPTHATQIEIIRGPATLLYGNGASGGIVNIVNEHLSEDAENGYKLGGDGRYSGNGRDGSGHLEGHWGNGLFKAHFDGARHSNADYDIPGFADTAGAGVFGRLGNSFSTQENGSLSLGYTGDDHSASLAFSTQDGIYGLPNEATALIRQNQNRFDLRATARNPLPGIEAARVQLGYNVYRHTEFEDPVTPGTLFNNAEVDSRIEVTHAALGPFNGAFGLQIGNRDFAAVGDEALVGQVTTDNLAFFLVEDLKLPRGTLEFGTRVESVSHLPDAAACTLPATLGRGVCEARDRTPVSLAVGYLLPFAREYHARLNFSRSQRAPRPEELYSFGNHAAVGAFERGNPAFGLETGNNFELSLDKHVGRWTGSVAVYYNAFDDYIFQRAVDCNADPDTAASNPGDPGCAPDGIADRVAENPAPPPAFIFDPAGDTPLLDYAQADARFYGVELQSALELISGGPFDLTGRVFTDFVQGRLGNNGGSLPRITPTRFGFGFDARFGGLAGSLDIVSVQEQNRLSSLETATRGYALVNLDLGYDFKLGDRAKATLYLRGRNLADEEIRHHTSFIKDLVTAPGRALFTGLRVEFGGRT